MKHTAAFIDSYVRRQQPPMKHKEIAAQMRVDATAFSGWRLGKSEHVRHETLINMQSALDNNEDQAQLLAAYLHDQCVGPGAGLISIQIGTPGESAVVRDNASVVYSGQSEAYKGVMDALLTAKPDFKMRTCLEKLIGLLPRVKYLSKVLQGVAGIAESSATPDSPT